MLALCAGNSFFTTAQSVWQVFDTSNSGIPNNTIQATLIDSMGNLWVGTDNGLVMYDGSNWTEYNTGNSDIPSNVIRSLNVDYDGDLWVGTFDDGVAEFDGTNWTTYHIGNSGIVDNYVRAIAFDVHNNPFFGTSGGLVYYDFSTWTYWNNMNSSFFANNIGSIAIDQHNVKHIGVLNGGLTILDSANANITVFTSFNSNIADNTLKKVAFDDNDILWAATPAAGVIAYNGNNSWQWFADFNSLIPTNACNYILPDHGSNVKYVATMDEGFLEFDGVINFTGFNTANSGIPENFISNILKDDNDVIWLGTGQSGLVRYDKILAIEQTDIYSSLSVYPTLIRDEQLVSFNQFVDDATVMLVDVEGRILHEQVLNNQNQLELPANLNAGIYFLRFATATESYSFRIVKI